MPATWTKLFDFLSEADAAWFAASGIERYVSHDEVLMEQGSSPDSVCFITEGEFTVQTQHQGDRLLARLKPGEVVGEMAFVIDRPRSATVLACGYSKVFEVPSEALRQRLEADLDFARRFYEKLTRMLCERLVDVQVPRKVTFSLEFGAGDAPPRNLDPDD